MALSIVDDNYLKWCKVLRAKCILCASTDPTKTHLITHLIWLRRTSVSLIARSQGPLPLFLSHAKWTKSRSISKSEYTTIYNVLLIHNCPFLFLLFFFLVEQGPDIADKISMVGPLLACIGLFWIVFTAWGNALHTLWCRQIIRRYF
jgi:hypothetical protein